MPDRTIVALLGPADGATCTDPGCTLLGPCAECEERRHLAAREAEQLAAQLDADAAADDELRAHLDARGWDDLD